MSIGGIDKSRIDAMVAQLRAAAAKMENVTPNPIAGNASPAPKLDFADALKSSLEQVSAAQSASQALGKRFAMGDDSVNMSDMMISMQKASISFQATVQVRNKLISAYQDIMNMQI
ncbi:flagellar hook-basal body complex protein FliE [Undibacterium macrobrachii]|uniref:Flagellar hook-basal body complex protein FliE n=1 Tax=Undibacterium macrobrachii TaxID=1119058 RepID=A0ABQ2XIX9_9BURK|nr:flagellar hook-basal body complex protein FliE [Undibacterium macrobrachii]GGX19432.1 flagellar hook-basal body complex protein FliE [Undibacterium macrobrachii]